MTFIIPDNNEGYDNILYGAYFKPSTITSGKTMGKYAIAFIDAVKALPDNVDRFAGAAMGNAITAYSFIMANQDELQYVDGEIMARFLQARRLYNADCVSYAIRKLYAMDATEYSYNALRNATEMYNALSDEEKLLVANASVLSTKLDDLKAALNVESIDFTKDFSYYVSPEGPVEEPADNANLTLIICLSCVGGALVIAAAVVTPILVIKKKRKQNEQ